MSGKFQIYETNILLYIHKTRNYRLGDSLLYEVYGDTGLRFRVPFRHAAIDDLSFYEIYTLSLESIYNIDYVHWNDYV